MPASVRPARRLRLRQAKSAERDCCNYCQCLFHVFVSLRRMIAPSYRLLTADPILRLQKNLVVPSIVACHAVALRGGWEEFRGETFKVSWRDPSTPSRSGVFARDDTFL